MQDSIEVVVKSVTHEAKGINAWELCHPDGRELPPFTAGAHIGLHLANGMVRSYSLCNSQDERHRYVVAVNHDPHSRGGSRFIHEALRAGDRLRIWTPRNNFALVENAPHVVFIAGGIGITPLYSMIQRLESIGRSWELHYSARVREACAFRESLKALDTSCPGRVQFNFDQEPGGHLTDIAALIAQAPPDAHLYCCGPNPMLQVFEQTVTLLGRPPSQIHVEYFAAHEEAATAGGFTVVLARSNRSFQVEPGHTILDTLLDNHVDVPFSCRQGVCGACETRVIDGSPDHRDSLLSPEEKASNATIMICCSGCKSEKLVLDI
ncbi:2Fe-2S iron-sulfur cluster binding domain protein [Burkholderia cenocepacia]|uniref:2Fe-2S iron-sulfur cluster binding domain protein n=1 Tax=Burkholderia cenocepacia TaxID=95486 RepID=A0AAN0VMT6_9BURK|nr:2Fe-2S iron-sulfur cluster binding domain protein [Burkholderia cenocepacia]